MRTHQLAAALVAQAIAISGGVQAQDVRITRAIYGTAQGSADVTPVVAYLARPGLTEFYAAPLWLEVDPAVGFTKDLVIFYEYRGAPHVLTTRELTAVSNTILIEHADPARRPRTSANDSGIVIIHAWYGPFRNFDEVSTQASEIFRRGGQAVILSDTLFLPRATMGNKVLIVTYSYNGIRTTWSGWSGTRASHDALVVYAELGGQERLHSDTVPAWLQDAHPFPPLPPGTPGPGTGRATRQELGISELLRAVAELEAIPAAARSAAVTTALTATKLAVMDAQVNIGYLYPPAAVPQAKAQGTSTAARLSNAVRSLATALDQLSASNPARGRGASAAAMARCIAEINEALTALR